MINNNFKSINKKFKMILKNNLKNVCNKRMMKYNKFCYKNNKWIKK